jgi:hypothetical protein
MLKLVALVALFAGFCWFGTQVPLGSHTLFGHLHAIAGTRESQDLFDGTKESTRPLVDDVRRRIAGAADPTEVARGKSDSKTETKTETKAEARADKADKVETKSSATSSTHPGAGAPHEEISNAERRRLRRLISTADGSSARR